MFPLLPHHILNSGDEISPRSSSKTAINLQHKNVKSSIHRNVSVDLMPRENFPSVTKVTAMTDIPHGICSEDIDVGEVDGCMPRRIRNVLALVTEEGRLKTFNCSSRWLLEARISDDCQSYNVIVQRGSGNNKIKFQTVRIIRNGEELRLWFSEEVLATLSIPFLSPANIQGEKKYVCHKCNQQFENPNPLKIHLALNCDRIKKQELWSRLRNISAVKNQDPDVHKSLTSMETVSSFPHCIPSTTSTDGFKLELTTKQTVRKNLVISLPQDLSTISSAVHNSNISSSFPFSAKVEGSEIPSYQNQRIRQEVKPMLESLDARVSAFKPYLNKPPFSSSVMSDGTNSKTEMPTVSNILSTLKPSLLVKPHYVDDSSSHVNTSRSNPVSEHLNRATIMVPRIYHKHNILPSSNFPLQHSTTNARSEFHHAAEMETLVSNLGRSKQGHLCIYCGKIYSRKYGLKIHIRTHTGYKPLKCKFCMRPFGDPSNLNKHVRLHAEGDTPYRCNLCGKILVRRRDLERHIKSRHFAHIETHKEEETNRNSS